MGQGGCPAAATEAGPGPGERRGCSFFHPVGPGDQTQFVRPSDKSLYPLSHLASHGFKLPWVHVAAY